MVAVPTSVRLEGEAHFYASDTNRSGTIDLYELVVLMQRAGYSGTTGQYEQFFDMIDRCRPPRPPSPPAPSTRPQPPPPLRLRVPVLRELCKWPLPPLSDSPSRRSLRQPLSLKIGPAARRHRDGDGEISRQEWVVAFSHLKRAGLDGATSWNETKQQVRASFSALPRTSAERSGQQQHANASAGVGVPPKQAAKERFQRSQELHLSPRAAHWHPSGRNQISRLCVSRPFPRPIGPHLMGHPLVDPCALAATRGGRPGCVHRLTPRLHTVLAGRGDLFQAAALLRLPLGAVLQMEAEPALDFRLDPALGVPAAPAAAHQRAGDHGHLVGR